jgi:hypothetical protein
MGNPAAFLPVFLTGATVIYIATSFAFLVKAIDGKGTVKASLKDWIRVNAFVALFFSMLMLVQSVVLLQQPALLQQAMEQAAQQAKWAGAAASEDSFKNSMRVVLVCMALLGVAVQIHVFGSFRLMRLHADRFVS